MSESVVPRATCLPLQVQKHLLLRLPEKTLRSVVDVDVDVDADVGADVGADMREAVRSVTSQAVNLPHG